MEFLSEDPTYLAGGLGLLAAGLLIALWITQQGKYLIWAGAALLLALAVVGIEQLWVTDNERIEHVVKDLRRAVAAADAEGALAHMTPDVEYVQGGNTVSGEATRRYVRSILESAKFDFLQISNLRTNAGGQSRRGSAEFRVLAGGSYQTPSVTYNFGTTGSDWSLGFEETAPHVWKVNRISPIRIPREVVAPRP